ncbi:MAG: peptidoglycan DD-metalloendopeptidase family protein [Buchnera aphidicola (Microlophium carnosum)]|uniref:Peptidoglycan DD-metalloendopeptidase family protein n=1 Tax=Buchnera aphidicola (Microlophium carnosum) TaxID=2708354 RepID=A0A6G9JVA1_9GAMM|nr:MAG: peptidoglycan DD-metalloendopeptidase family protein [Buchnera aphidicola (Microlophium carnosum)]
MQFKIFLFKFFFLTLLLFFCNNFGFGFSINNRNNSNNNLDKKYINDFLFLNKNQFFSFLKSEKIFFSKREKIIIRNNNFIGFFRENRFRIFYTVKSKDTLYSIAKNSGHNYYELSKFNSIKKPYKIIVGQKIWMGDFLIRENNCFIINSQNNTIKKNSSCKSIFKNLLNITNFLKENTESSKICFFCSKESKKNNDILKCKSFDFSNNWYWPVKDKRIKYFYNDILDNTKIEISGFKGQPIFAAARGEVVCVTDIFKKYGRLIIIRHNKNYLSIYAFNHLVLVKEKDQVYANQQIATMGLSSETNLPRLYFEIRYLGDSINPLHILPKI